MMKQAKDTEQTGIGGHTRTAASMANSAAWNELKKAGVGITEKEVQAQQIFVDALNAQVGIQSRIQQLKTVQSSNAVKTEQKGEDGEAEKLWKAQAAEQKKAEEEAQKLWEENYRRALAALQESEREKIDTTDRASSGAACGH